MKNETELLQECKLQLEYLNEKFGETGTTNSLLTKIDAALQQNDVSGSVLKINLTEYGYSCGDGCCYNYGTITTVNGVELPFHNQDAVTILIQVLEHLGYKVEIEYSDDVE